MPSRSDDPTAEYREGNLRCRLFFDDDAQNPRTDWDQLGTMALFVSRYDLGDMQDPMRSVVEHAADHLGRKHLNRKIELYLKLFHGATVVRPVYAHIHSGVSVSMGSYSDPWDSGRAGWVFDTPERREAMGFTEEDGTPEKIEAALRSEVETYDQYLTGMVFGYVLERVSLDEDGDPIEGTEEEIDSLWGLFGYEYAHEEAKRVLATYAADATENYDPVQRAADSVRGIPFVQEVQA